MNTDDKESCLLCWWVWDGVGISFPCVSQAGWNQSMPFLAKIRSPPANSNLQCRIHHPSSPFKMPDNHLPRMVFFRELSTSVQLHGRPKKMSRDHLKLVLNSWSIQHIQLEHSAQNQHTDPCPMSLQPYSSNPFTPQLCSPGFCPTVWYLGKVFLL